MPTSTSRFGLIKPSGPEFQDVGVINNNYDTIDSLLGALPVTSGTRPASPGEGMLIRETDTEITYMYYQGSWRYVAGPLRSNFTKASFTGTANQSVVITAIGLNNAVGSPNVGTNASSEFIPGAGVWAIQAFANYSASNGGILELYAVTSNRVIASGGVNGSPSDMSCSTTVYCSATTRLAFRIRSGATAVALTNMQFDFYRVA